LSAASSADAVMSSHMSDRSRLVTHPIKTSAERTEQLASHRNQERQMANDPTDIYAWQRLDARTTTSGFLKAEDIAKLDGLGVRHVINLAPDGRDGALEGEAGMLAERGIRYSYIPVPFEAPGEGHFKEFRQAYEGSHELVHVHCIANWRVSAFFFRFNRDCRKMNVGEARALMEQQWSPESWDHEMAPAWVDFIAEKEV
jgi:protein tyrosine phosphatase (PTP) superfamily phosphohydrolase (DUF442 family)